MKKGVIFALSNHTQKSKIMEIINKQLIETYKGIEIYKHETPYLSHYLLFYIDGFQYLWPNIRLSKNDITRALNKKNKNK